MKRKKMRYVVEVVIFLLLGIIFLYFENNSITVTQYVYENKKIPASFNQFKIVQVSDLHNKEFGKGQKRLLNLIKKEKPDCIVITGDLIDSNRTNVATAITFVKGAVKLAPVYYVAGNHEAWSDEYGALKEQLLENGVMCLENQKVNINRGTDKIEVAGLSDPAFLKDTEKEGLEQYFKILEEDHSDTFQILLSHRPESFSQYVNFHADLVFCGHAHGGQFRIPFVGGLYAPDQGFFPKYTSGMYKKENTSMVVSRGLGNSVIPIRLFNRPELIVVTLKQK